ncbi:MAG: ParA family protein [Woeseiaceae bacterium]|nr:ParA family protein [Woeseiaceae bacterium]
MKNVVYRDDSNKIVVLNPKGGCGKTTLATNLASYFARRGPAPTLIDTDPIGYSSRWLERRPEGSPIVHGIRLEQLDTRRSHLWGFRSSKEAGAVIIDTPAALTPREIADITEDADCILVPVLPSAFDVHVSTKFIADLLLITNFERPIGVIANRTRKNTKSMALLLRTLASFETPTIGVLRDSQNFVRATSEGLGIFDLPPHRVKQDVERMSSVINWIDETLTRSVEVSTVSRFNPLSKLFASGSAHPD